MQSGLFVGNGRRWHLFSKHLHHGSLSRGLKIRIFCFSSVERSSVLVTVFRIHKSCLYFHQVTIIINDIRTFYWYFWHGEHSGGTSERRYSHRMGTWPYWSIWTTVFRIQVLVNLPNCSFFSRKRYSDVLLIARRWYFIARPYPWRNGSTLS